MKFEIKVNKNYFRIESSYWGKRIYKLNLVKKIVILIELTNVLTDKNISTAVACFHVPDLQIHDLISGISGEP